VKNLKNDPGDVARVIARAATSRNPRLRYPVGGDVKLGVFLRRWLPANTFEWLFQKIMDRTLG
jgi:hypothetical protein